MDRHDFVIEELEERIAPSSFNMGAAGPAGDGSAATPIQTEPHPWHPLWPVDPWPPTPVQ